VCCLMYGSENRPLKAESKIWLNRTETSTSRWICEDKLTGRRKREKLRELLGLEPVSMMIKKSFAHVERKNDTD